LRRLSRIIIDPSGQRKSETFFPVNGGDMPVVDRAPVVVLDIQTITKL
jgi:hypothetical protein